MRLPERLQDVSVVIHESASAIANVTAFVWTDAMLVVLISSNTAMMQDQWVAHRLKEGKRRSGWAYVGEWQLSLPLSGSLATADHPEHSQ